MQVKGILEGQEEIQIHRKVLVAHHLLHPFIVLQYLLICLVMKTRRNITFKINFLMKIKMKVSLPLKNKSLIHRTYQRGIVSQARRLAILC